MGQRDKAPLSVLIADLLDDPNGFFIGIYAPSVSKFKAFTDTKSVPLVLND
jgi:hypothetical protein